MVELLYMTVFHMVIMLYKVFGVDMVLCVAHGDSAAHSNNVLQSSD